MNRINSSLGYIDDLFLKDTNKKTENEENRNSSKSEDGEQKERR